MTKPAQLTLADLKTMTPQQIEAARTAGQLVEVLGGTVTPLTQHDLAHMRPEEIAAAEKAGRLDHLFNLPDDAA
jgi:hypothetical protein